MEGKEEGERKTIRRQVGYKLVRKRELKEKKS